MKKFEENVRWNFQLASHGYGKNVKEALLDATQRLEREIEMDYHDVDFEAIEIHETISINEDDTLDDYELKGGLDVTE